MCTKVMINCERVTIYKGFFLYLSLFILRVKRKVFLEILLGLLGNKSLDRKNNLALFYIVGYVVLRMNYSVVKCNFIRSLFLMRKVLE